MNKLYREASGNVVLRSGKTALRFFKDYGGTPLEFWYEPYPLLSNSWPGSGASWTCEVGQDPTQASANGITPHPICCFNLPATYPNNYYIRESLFDHEGCNYQVSGFYPDFWLSHDTAIDDYKTSPNWTSGTNPTFLGSAASNTGFFCPGNEMEPGNIRRYPNGRIAFKTTIKIEGAGTAGACFRKVCPIDKPSTANLATASGYLITVNAAGNWFLSRSNFGSVTTLANGTLRKAHRQALASTGLELEVRTNNALRGIIDIYFNGTFYKEIDDPNPILGDCFGLYASTSTGRITFSNRQVFDLGLQFSALYSPAADDSIRANFTINTYEPRDMYRAVYGIFLNQPTFPLSVRATEIIENGIARDIDGQLVPVDSNTVLYAGHWDGSHGIKFSEITAIVDGHKSAGAHALLQKLGANNEFVIMVNALPAYFKGKISSVSLGLKISCKK